jgi:8-oxo-dGTP pyrophosphatase MutT (NUDIX family)
MTTTAIVAEILIVGLEAAAWLFLLILAVLGPGGLRMADLRGWEVLVTLVALGAAYVLGVVVDRIADDLRYWLDRVWPGRPVDKPADITMTRMRLVIMRQGGDLSAFVLYQRSRMRIARSTVLNLILAIPVVLLFLTSWNEFSWPAAAVLVILLFLAIVTLFAYRQMEFAYVSWLSQAYRLLTTSSNPIGIAAAVPYRLKDGKIQFLLVRTKQGGKYWTLPKGHRQQGETLPESAQREAREEAGIKGRLDPEPLMDFVYPNPSDPQNPDPVTAYLLEVLDLEGNGEPGREPSWLSPDDAGAKLGEGGREPRYARGLRAVMQCAEREIAARHNVT